MNGLLLRFIISLFLTLVIELVVACLFRVKGKDLLLIVLVNVLTNPAAVLLSAFAGNKRIVQLVIEAVVILIEGWYYKKYSNAIGRGYVFSLMANGISYGIGIILPYIIFVINSF